MCTCTWRNKKLVRMIFKFECNFAKDSRREDIAVRPVQYKVQGTIGNRRIGLGLG